MLTNNLKTIYIKSYAEIDLMRQAGKIVAAILQEIKAMTRPGISTFELDMYAEKRIREMGAFPSFKGYHGFPATICACVNQEVVHGIPRKNKIIKEGDLVKIDLGACFQGYHGDSCVSFGVGKITQEAQNLLMVAEIAMYQGISQIKEGNYLIDLAIAIEDYVISQGFCVVEDLVGHGIGRNLHEEPSVFHCRVKDLPHIKLKAGMTLAIEPVINRGSNRIKTLKDGWTVVTVDNLLSANYEHTVLVTPTGYEILTK